VRQEKSGIPFPDLPVKGPASGQIEAQLASGLCKNRLQGLDEMKRLLGAERQLELRAQTRMPGLDGKDLGFRPVQIRQIPTPDSIFSKTHSFTNVARSASASDCHFSTHTEAGSPP